MYTGYFAKIKEYEQAGLIPISIAAKAPDWYDGLEFEACPRLKTEDIPTTSRL